MISTTIFKRGHLVIVLVPFSNHSGVKPRPALVISTESFHRAVPDLIVCPVSSQPRYYRRPGNGDIPLLHWKTPRLRHPSTVRISKLLSVDKQIIKGVLGTVSRHDLLRVEVELRKALGLK